MLRRLTRLLWSSEPKPEASLVECKRCGTTLESKAVERCPECGSPDIATYFL
ncbi:small CPxCG-related zinc finger protein (plasmid) [Halobacterium salinarum]|uniref:Small CPxCG-related zinc finger protein n=1 Tax=Halobacterium salinarum (strain ATCC 33171 / DSM 3754 / JCM 8978 / NBRC 102687 / NCIMB 764 / 91-R6) TaxID=2597657 RepID=A0A4D6GWJ9_HALS9|nr:small CPxCG-related zinc finger protein [Halobacterium salinarum]